jgi:hypothetical protein
VTKAPALLSIPSWRREWEAARAVEIQRADEALQRSRFRWFLLGLATALLGYIPMLFAGHIVYGEIMFYTALLLTNVGPMTVLWLAAKSEEP